MKLSLIHKSNVYADHGSFVLAPRTKSGFEFPTSVTASEVESGYCLYGSGLVIYTPDLDDFSLKIEVYSGPADQEDKAPDVEFSANYDVTDISICVCGLLEEMAKAPTFKLAKGSYDCVVKGYFTDSGNLYRIFLTKRKSKASRVSKSKMTIESLLKSGTNDDFRKNKKLLESQVDWTPEMFHDAVETIKKLAPPARLLLSDALRIRNGIPKEDLKSLQTFVTNERDTQLLGNYVYYQALFDFEALILWLVAEKNIGDFMSGITFQISLGSYVATETFQKLLASPLELKVLQKLLQVFQFQCDRKNWLGDFADQRLMTLLALGKSHLPIEVRKEMFLNLRMMQIHSLSDAAKKIKLELHEDSLTLQFGSVETFMDALEQTLAIPEIFEFRSFQTWLAALRESADPEFRLKTLSRWQTLWLSADKVAAKLSTKPG